jgi:hypothetical protein
MSIRARLPRKANVGASSGAGWPASAKTLAASSSLPCSINASVWT